MAAVTVNCAGKSPISVNAGPQTNLLESLQKAGMYIPAICGGKGSCGKCGIRLASGTLPVTPSDSACFSAGELDAGWRLACTAFPAGDIAITIPESGEGQFSAVDNFVHQEADRGSVRTGGEALHAAAVDIGTTTLGFALLDLRTGKILSRHSAVNRQRESGGDVISRIQKANEGGLLQLSRCVRGQIAEGIAALCAKAAAATESVCRVAITGNTTMLHLLLGLSCQTLGKAPFTPVTVDMVFAPYWEIITDGPRLDTGCEAAILPGISTYVGADITAGLYFTGLHKHDAPAVFIDIGTNGEIALAYNGKIICAATAAGPAFEGGNILCGTGSVPGAISRVRFQDGHFAVDIIDDKPPVGICGSGVVDMVCQGLRHGYIQPSGRFTEKVRDNKIPLATGIVFCQKDVRELQMGKSAIRTGLDALLNHAGLGYDDIQTLYIAGGFGFNLDMESAAGIGLIPPALLPKVSLVGNSALGGAVRYLLDSEGEEELNRIINLSEEFSLPADNYFKEYFINNVNFE